MPYARTTAGATRPQRQRKDKDGDAHKERARPKLAPQPGEHLIDWIPRISPDLDRPQHLFELCELAERLPHAGMREVVAAPVQHGKTSILTRALVYALCNDPTLQIIYASYSYQFAQRQSRLMRNLAIMAGLNLKPDFATIAEWQVEQGGGILATSVGGVMTGHPGQIIVVDDPFKNLEEAESADHRDMVDDWFKSCALTRLARDSSVMIVASRWHEDDLSGRRIADGWHNTCLSAISDDGEALWPEVRPLDFLVDQKKALGDYLFWALFMGKPKPREGSLFKPPTFYTDAPMNFCAFIGADLAYSDSSASDYTAAVVLGKVGDKFYVLDGYHGRNKLDDTEAALRFWAGKYPGAEIASYVSGAERGAIDLLMQRDLDIYPLPAKWAKYIRAQVTAAAWNDGRILVPANAPWVESMIKEVTRFTGTKADTHDDWVDALVSAFDWADGGDLSDIGSFTAGKRCL